MAGARRTKKVRALVNEPGCLGRYEVMIPAWNAAETIGCTIDSILAQSHPPSRITVVDDGSTDDTVHISRSRGIDVVCRPHLGLIAIRNFCLEFATEPLFCMLDSDDYWLPHMAETQLQQWNISGIQFAAIGACADPFGDSLSGWTKNGQPKNPVSEILPLDAWNRNPLTSSMTLFQT